MASTYTGLGTELMTTGENAGDWGSKTNTNLQIIEQIAGGYTAQSIAGSAQTTTLSVSDGSTGAVLAHRIIEFTGTITGNQVVTIPLDVQTFYIAKNNTSGAYTVQFKYVSGSGSSVTWAATDKGTKLLYATADDGTNPNLVDSNIGGVGTYDLDGGELTLDADSDTSITASTDDQIDFEIAGADDFTMTANAFNVLTGSAATFADSSNAKFGTGNDMLMYHDGSNSYITNATGALKIATETSGIALTIGHTTSETTIADNLTVTGDAAIDGTTNLDAVDIDGAVQIDAAFTSGVDGQGYDTKFFGDTSSAYMLWDTSADDLVFAGAAGIDLAGDIDVDGTANLDVVDIDGAVDMASTLAVAGVSSFAVAANVAQVALTSSSNAVAWDASAAANAYHLTTENTTLSAPTNAVEGAFICIEINFDGSHTFSWNAIFNFAADTAPTTTDTNAKTDIFVFRYNGAIWQEVGRTLNIPES